MDIEVHYGSGNIRLDIPDKNIARFIRPWQSPQHSDSKTTIANTLAAAASEAFRRDIRGKKLCLMLPDATRDMPLDDIFEQLFPMLRETASILLLICSGTHSPKIQGNEKIIRTIEQAAQTQSLRNFTIHIHNCQADSFVNAGSTSLGTEVIYNSIIDPCEVFLVLSDVKFHYFAGYSNPVKYFLPGICTYKTAEQNHSQAMDQRAVFGLHPWHKDPARRDNPVAADGLEGAKLIIGNRPFYAFATISTGRQIQWAGLGPASQVCAETFEITDKHNLFKVKPADCLIVSPGGLPNDIDLYIAQRALELTSQAVKPGGQILFISECPAGIGEEHTIENFYNRLKTPVEGILAARGEKYKLFSHKAYRFAALIRKTHRIYMHTSIADNLLQAIHLYPAHWPSRIVDAWIDENPDVKINIVDSANKLAIFAD